MDGDAAGSLESVGGEDGGREQGSPGSRRTYIIVGAVLLVVAAAAFFYAGGPQALPGGGEQQQQQDGTDAFEQYASGSEETGTTDTEGATLGATVEIQQYGTSPSRVEIKTGETVRWQNTNDFPVTLSFDRTSQTPTIEPGGTVEMRFRGITGYTITNADSGEKHSSGQIYVE